MAFWLDLKGDKPVLEVVDIEMDLDLDLECSVWKAELCQGGG